MGILALFSTHWLDATSMDSFVIFDSGYLNKYNGMAFVNILSIFGLLDLLQFFQLLEFMRRR